MSNSRGQIVWQASYKTWGNTVSEVPGQIRNQEIMTHYQEQMDGVPRIDGLCYQAQCTQASVHLVEKDKAELADLQDKMAKVAAQLAKLKD